MAKRTIFTLVITVSVLCAMGCSNNENKNNTTPYKPYAYATIETIESSPQIKEYKIVVDPLQTVKHNEQLEVGSGIKRIWEGQTGDNSVICFASESNNIDRLWVIAKETFNPRNPKSIFNSFMQAFRLFIPLGNIREGFNSYSFTMHKQTLELYQVDYDYERKLLSGLERSELRITAEDQLFKVQPASCNYIIRRHDNNKYMHIEGSFTCLNYPLFYDNYLNSGQNPEDAKRQYGLFTANINMVFKCRLPIEELSNHL